MKKEQHQISCKLTSPELQKRKSTVITKLKTLVLARQEFADGLSLKFNGTDAILDKLTDFVKTERLCCEFFNFQITIEQDFAWLKIYGDKGAKEFLLQEIGF